MSSHECPICNRPNAFPIWLDTQPPDTCAFEPTCRIKEDCPQIQADDERRRLVPECFDADGKLLPDQLIDMLDKWHARIPSDARAMARVQREHERRLAHEANEWDCEDGDDA